MKGRSNSTRSEGSETTSTKSGFVSIIGAPNAGKSTLLNALLGTKVSITTPRPNTTRNRITGILTTDEYQMVFLDTPGVHMATKAFDRQMVSLAISTIADADIVILVIDVLEGLKEIDEQMIKRFKSKSKPAIAVINKVDLVKDKSELLPLMDNLAQEYEFKAVLPMSALKKDGIGTLISEMEALLPYGPMYYPRDMVTEYSDDFFVSEIIRETILGLLEEEVPHCTAVTVKGITEKKDCIRILADIHVEKSSQKGIVIGKGAAMLKKIGIRSRKALEKAFGGKVYLELNVRVEKNWRKDPKAWQKLKYM